jgi:hypothetical protein
LSHTIINKHRSASPTTTDRHRIHGTSIIAFPDTNNGTPIHLIDIQWSELINELRVIANRIRRYDNQQLIRTEWKFAAQVIDRLCFIIFTTFLFVVCMAILWAAPHLIA